MTFQAYQYQRQPALMQMEQQHRVILQQAKQKLTQGQPLHPQRKKQSKMAAAGGYLRKSASQGDIAATDIAMVIKIFQQISNN